MAQDWFHQWQTYLLDRTGVFIPESKAYLFVNRLNHLLKQTHSRDLAELYQRLADSADDLHDQVVEVMTTHETSFFRDPVAFDLLAEMFWAHQSQAGEPFHVWSAACSSGEEPYSIAMTLEHLSGGRAGAGYRILASDIAASTLARAEQGLFRQLRGGIRAGQKRRFFERTERGWRVKAKLRRHMEFRHINLAKLEPSQRKFQAIFCCNVAIYFHPDARRRLFVELADRLLPNGVLILGGGESLGVAVSGLNKACRAGFFYYRKQA